MVQIVCSVLTVFNAVFQFVSYLPQIIKLIKTKSSDDISAISWIIYVLVGLSYFVLLLLTSASVYLLTLQILAILLDSVTLFLVIKYQLRAKKNPPY